MMSLIIDKLYLVLLKLAKKKTNNEFYLTLFDFAPIKSAKKMGLNQGLLFEAATKKA